VKIEKRALRRASLNALSSVEVATGEVAMATAKKA
jgi:hypothetical protein